MSWAVVTGASSGIGREIAKNLADRGYNLVLAARRTERLQELSLTFGTEVEILGIDLSKEENVLSLYDRCKDKDVEILVNNAGFGTFGEFSKTELSKDLDMIALNIEAVHILTKLFLRDFIKKDKGRILNVASAAGFMPSGPLLSTYYATKHYVLTLGQSIAKELKKSGSRVTVSTLCPGPVKTEFDSVAGVEFGAVGMEAKRVADIAVSGMLAGKIKIIPGFFIKAGRIFTKVLPDGVTAAFAYKFQKAKEQK